MAQLKKKVSLKRKVELPNETPEPGKKSNKLIQYILLGLGVVLIGGYFLFPFNSEKSNSNENLDQTREREVVVPTDNSQGDNTENTIATENGVEVSGDGVAVDQVVNENMNTEVNVNSADVSKNSIQSVSENGSKEPVKKVESISEKPEAIDQTKLTSTNGTLEEKANQVIKGIYGNGMDRKNALGSEYKVIQDKVNELYKKGQF